MAARGDDQRAALLGAGGRAECSPGLPAPGAGSVNAPALGGDGGGGGGGAEGGTAAAGAVFIVVNAALGAGLLNFPAAFGDAGGVVAGFSLQMVLLVFIVSGLLVLALCAGRSGARTYQEVVRAQCGAHAGAVCEGCIALYTFGTCVTFLVIVGDQLDMLVQAVSHRTHVAPVPWFCDRRFTISVVSVVLILPLCFPREIGFQKYASLFGVLGTWYVTGVIIVKFFLGGYKHGEIITRPSSLAAVFNAIPTICFGFQCHVSSVPIYHSMRRPTLARWGGVVTAATLICLLVYTGTGVCGYLTFGASVSPDVLLSYPSGDVAIAIARLFLIVTVLTSYPILHFCGRAVLEGLWLRWTGVCTEAEPPGRERRRRAAQTLGWFLLSLLLAIFTPDIGRVIALIGGLAAAFILIFPGLCLLCFVLNTERESILARLLLGWSCVMVTLGTFLLVQSTAAAIERDVRHH
uniref:Sodium-coupled neutral amino acid transporter 7 n=1 Tax=Petromyzon marinus TaxID=7757 RepID=A0AAJ7XIT0_PETMA|nr:putative sodium-coupled neutral amino acid transporter 7 [Petromyzon marinus]